MRTIDSIPLGTPFGAFPVPVYRATEMVASARLAREVVSDLVNNASWDDVVNFGRGCNYPVGDRDDMDSELLITYLCWAYAIAIVGRDDQ
jgi:hypothetical protein